MRRYYANSAEKEGPTSRKPHTHASTIPNRALNHLARNFFPPPRALLQTRKFDSPGTRRSPPLRLFVRLKRIARAVTDMQHRHDTVALVDCVDDPVAISLAPIEQLAKIAAFGNGRASGRELVEAQNRLLKPVEPSAGQRGILGVDSQEMRLRSPAVRSVRSTRYAMIGADFVEQRASRPHPAEPAVLKPLPDTFGSACLRCQVEQMLIGFRILDDRSRLAVHGQDHRAPGVLEVPHDFRRVVAGVVIGWMSLVMSMRPMPER
jgi:hypothetical protein